MGASAGVETAATVAVTLRRIADERAARLPRLTDLVADAVAEINGSNKRGPTRAAQPPDALGRLCDAFERIVVLEAQCRAVVDDLRAGLYDRATVGSPGRPAGYTPAQAAVASQRMAARRGDYLKAMSKALHALCQNSPTRPRRLSGSGASALRGEIRAILQAEERARHEQLALIELVTRSS